MGDGHQGGAPWGTEAPLPRPGLGDTPSMCFSAAQGPGPDITLLPCCQDHFLGGGLLSSQGPGLLPVSHLRLCWYVPPPCCRELALPGDLAGVPTRFPALPGHGPFLFPLPSLPCESTPCIHPWPGEPAHNAPGSNLLGQGLAVVWGREGAKRHS